MMMKLARKKRKCEGKPSPEKTAGRCERMAAASSGTPIQVAAV